MVNYIILYGIQTGTITSMLALVLLFCVSLLVMDALVCTANESMDCT